MPNSRCSRALHFSDTVYGLGAGLFFIGYFLFEVPSNLILHRVGARRWLARIMITWGLLSAGMMFVSTPTQFYILRSILGAAEAGFFPGVIFYLTQWYPAARRGRVMALFMTAVALCSVIGSILSGAILQTFDGVSGWAGWQWLSLRMSPSRSQSRNGSGSTLPGRPSTPTAARLRRPLPTRLSIAPRSR